MIPKATLELYKNVDNSITVHGVYYGQKASKFVPIRRKFDELVQHMVEHHSLTCYLGCNVQEYHNLWTYTVTLQATSDPEKVDDVLAWYQEMAQKSFYTPEQYRLEQEETMVG